VRANLKLLTAQRCRDLSSIPFNQIENVKEEMERNTTPQSRTPEMLDLYCKMQLGLKGDIWALGYVSSFLNHARFCAHSSCLASFSRLVARLRANVLTTIRYT
jgi:hypothetical protein